MEDRFGRPSAGARAAAMLREHGSAPQAVARRWSVCQDDAEDAVQRGLEIYLRRADTLAPATELAWLKVVVIRTFLQPHPAGPSPIPCW
jgi:DNA-directed RNA polymerase specialized sigma24 family protein